MRPAKQIQTLSFLSLLMTLIMVMAKSFGA